MENISRDELIKTARQIREDVISMSLAAGSSHIGTALSIVDILTVLFFKELKLDPALPDWPERDRFILSKGHGGASLYATLARRGFFSPALLNEYCADGSMLIGHSDRRVPGVEASTGSLGHGLSIGVGMAIAAKYDKSPSRTFVLMGDGECDEGSIWEAAMSAAHFKLDRLVGIIDYNKIQALGDVSEVMNLEPLDEKFRAFGWATIEINGHDIGEIEDAVKNVPLKSACPTLIIAHTIKGKGISFMENKLLWHYKSLSKEEAEAALAELRSE